MFKPTRNDKKMVKPFILTKDGAGNVIVNKSGLVQSKLNFGAKRQELTSPGMHQIS